jgi:outer membrane lipoprotein LolB
MSRVAGVALACILLTACAGVVPTPESPQDWAARERRLAALDGWSLKGRLALRSPQDSFNGSMSWEQTRDRLDFRFRGPLGVSGFRLEGGLEDLVLTDADGERWYLRDPQGDLEARLGWSVPIASLRYWMLAVPDPASRVAVSYDTSGRLAQLVQRDWTVQYQSYRQYDGEWLPHKLVVEGNGLRLRLAVDTWRLDGASAGPS